MQVGHAAAPLMPGQVGHLPARPKAHVPPLHKAHNGEVQLRKQVRWRPGERGMVD
jgi:hypothetical protein